VCVSLSLSVQLLSLPLCVALCAAHVTWTGTDKLGFRPRAQFKKKIICRLVYNEIFPLVGFAGGARWKTHEVKKLISFAHCQVDEMPLYFPHREQKISSGAPRIKIFPVRRKKTRDKTWRGFKKSVLSKLTKPETIAADQAFLLSLAYSALVFI
jgi:hypothetical protein